MKNLSKLALEATKKNLQTSRKVKNVNDRIVEVLGDGKKKLEREELVVEITNLRVTEEKEFDGKLPTLDEAAAMFEANNAEFIEHYIKCHKTVKNGVDTSISHSNNNSSFHYNEKYANMTLQCEDNKYFIVTK